MAIIRIPWRIRLVVLIEVRLSDMTAVSMVIHLRVASSS